MVEARDHMLVSAFINSTTLTVVSVTLLVFMGAMAAYVLQRRSSRVNTLVNSWCWPG